MIYLLVFLGGGIGSALRHAINLGAAGLLGFGFPFSRAWWLLAVSWISGRIHALAFS